MIKVDGIIFSKSDYSCNYHDKKDNIYRGVLVYYGLCPFKDVEIIPKSWWYNATYIVNNTDLKQTKKLSFSELMTLQRSHEVAGVICDSNGEIINVITLHRDDFRKNYFELLDYCNGVYKIKTASDIASDVISDFKFLYKNGVFAVSHYDYCILRELYSDAYVFGLTYITRDLLRNYLEEQGFNNISMEEIIKCIRKLYGIRKVKDEDNSSESDNKCISLSSNESDLVLNEPFIENKYNNYFDSDGHPIFDLNIGSIFYNKDNLKAKIVDLSKLKKQCSVVFEDGYEKHSLAVDFLYNLSHPVNDDMAIDNNKVYNGFQYRCVCKNCGYSKIMSKLAAQRHYFDCTRARDKDYSISTVSLCHRIDAQIEKDLNNKLAISNNASSIISYNKPIGSLDEIKNNLGLNTKIKSAKFEHKETSCTSNSRYTKKELDAIDKLQDSVTEALSKESDDSNISSNILASAFRAYYAGKH